jgi:hypothetical protein
MVKQKKNSSEPRVHMVDRLHNLFLNVTSFSKFVARMITLLWGTASLECYLQFRYADWAMFKMPENHHRLKQHAKYTYAVAITLTFVVFVILRKSARRGESFIPVHIKFTC